MTGGEVPAAVALVTKSVARWPTDARLRELQGDLDLRQGRAHTAERAYRKALRLDPANRALAVKIARSVLAQGRKRDALQMASWTSADTPGIRAGLAAVTLEARLDGSGEGSRELREEARSLWQLVGEFPDDAALQAVAARLKVLADDHAVVEAGRQHAQCRPPAVTAREPAAVGSKPAVRVGPGQRLKRPSEAAATVADGAVVEIEAGTYDGDVAVWTQDHLTLRAVDGRAQLRARGRTAEDKGIWVIKGDHTTVDGIEFFGARSPHRNGSGIRLEGSHLVVRDSLFHDNQMGILTSNNTPDSEILISHSEFRQNTSGAVEGELGHNIYIGRAGRFTLEFSYVHGADFGHNVKSRARFNRIAYNRIIDRAIAAAGVTILLVEQNAKLALEICNRGYVMESGEITLHDNAPALLVNNIFAGAPLASIVGNATTDQNVVLVSGGITDGTTLDFSLTPDSPAMDAGVEQSAAGQAVPVPEFEYVHPLQQQPRLRVWQRDAGAHEFCRQAAGL